MGHGIGLWSGERSNGKRARYTAGGHQMAARAKWQLAPRKFGGVPDVRYLYDMDALPVLLASALDELGQRHFDSQCASEHVTTYELRRKN